MNIIQSIRFAKLSMNILLLMGLGFSGCGKKQTSTKEDHTGHSAMNMDSIKNMDELSDTKDKNNMKKMPGMNNMKEMPSVDTSTMNMNNSVTLDDRGRLLIGIETDTVKMQTLHESNNLLGVAQVNENDIKVITSRVKGRIDQLFIRNPGDPVKAGQALYSIYSEELLADQKDYLSTISSVNEFGSQKDLVMRLTKAAREKLKRWDMTDAQVDQLAKNKKTYALMTYSSPASGYLSVLNVSEGQYVEIGSPLFQIASLNSVWVETQVFANEVKYLYDSPEVSIEFAAIPGKMFSAKLEFVTPSLEENKKINLARFRINNESKMVKPGMMAYVQFKREGKSTVVVPKSAVLYGKFRTVWVETAPNMFEFRMVKLGLENKSQVEITEGVNPGDIVVTRGSYLLNSAYIYKSGSGMQGMKM